MRDTDPEAISRQEVDHSEKYDQPSDSAITRIQGKGIETPAENDDGVENPQKEEALPQEEGMSESVKQDQSEQIDENQASENAQSPYQDAPPEFYESITKHHTQRSHETLPNYESEMIEQPIMREEDKEGKHQSFRPGGIERGF